MVRLCSKSSRPYSGRPAARAHRQRWGRWPGMAAVREQESAEAVVPRATSRQTPDGLTTREGLNLAGRTRPSVVLSRSDEADRLSIRAAITVAEKEWLLRPQGLPGTAVRGPACTVVWEPGGETLPATRLDNNECLSTLRIKTLSWLRFRPKSHDRAMVVSFCDRAFLRMPP
jgi:hypothetical protein